MARSSASSTHIGERTNEAWADQKADFYFAVVHAMLKTGFSPAEIGGENYLGAFGQAVAGHAG